MWFCEYIGGQQVTLSSYEFTWCDSLADMEISLIFFFMAILDVLQPHCYMCMYIYIQVMTASQNAFPHTTGVFSAATCSQSWDRAGIQVSAGRQFN